MTLDPRDLPPQPGENFGHIPERFREDYDPEPYTDPVSGVEYPVQARDVLDPQELHEYHQERRRRSRRSKRYT